MDMIIMVNPRTPGEKIHPKTSAPITAYLQWLIQNPDETIPARVNPYIITGVSNANPKESMYSRRKDVKFEIPIVGVELTPMSNSLKIINNAGAISQRPINVPVVNNIVAGNVIVLIRDFSLFFKAGPINFASSMTITGMLTTRLMKSAM